MFFRSTWFAVLIHAGLALSLTNSVSTAEAGRWIVNGTLVNVDDELGNTLRCPKANVPIRVRSRWTNEAVGAIEFPWGPTWNQSTTNSQGRFTSQSPSLGNMNRSRDVLVEFRKLNTWHTLKIIENLDLSDSPQITSNRWIFELGELETEAFDCPFQGTAASQVEPNPVLQKNPAMFGASGSNSSSTSGIDFEIVDSVIRRRTVNNQIHEPGRIEWEVTIRNNGSVDYSGTGEQLTAVQLKLFRESSQPIYGITMTDPIPAGESRSYFSPSQGNFGNTEDLLPYYSVLFTVDPDNAVAESNENNNEQPGCYSPLTETYNEGPCNETRGGSRSKQSNAKRSPVKKQSNKFYSQK